MTTNDDYIPTEILEINHAMLALYWEIMRNLDEYREDYEKFEKDSDGEWVLFSVKWSLLEPIDPDEDIVIEDKALYFIPDNVSLIETSSNKVTDGSYELRIALDIRRDTTTVLEEIKDKILEEKIRVLGAKNYKNILGEMKTQDSDHYKEVLYVHQLREAGFSYGEIFKMGKEKGFFKSEKEKGVFKDKHPDIVRNHLDKFDELKEKIPVPIVKE
jgi:hypothetical protein